MMIMRKRIYFENDWNRLGYICMQKNLCLNFYIKKLVWEVLYKNESIYFSWRRLKIKIFSRNECGKKESMMWVFEILKQPSELLSVQKEFSALRENSWTLFSILKLHGLSLILDRLPWSNSFLDSRYVFWLVREGISSLVQEVLQVDQSSLLPLGMIGLDLVQFSFF